MATSINTSSRVDQAADKAADRVKDIAGQAQDVAERAKAQAREAGEGMQEVAGNFKRALDRSVSEQPMATLAMAAMMGFVLGAIWKS